MKDIVIKTACVLDASVTLAWHFADEATAYADSVARALPLGQAWVPAIWPSEVLNGILMGQRRGRPARQEISLFMKDISAQPIEVDEQNPLTLWPVLLDFAVRYQLTAYDASYLELAKRIGLPLATLDKKLRDAAKRCGVGIFKP